MRRGIGLFATAALAFTLAAPATTHAVGVSHEWSKRLGGTSDELGYAVASDAEGSVIIGGYTGSTEIDLGGGALPSLGAGDLVIAKYSATGSHVWSKRLGGVGYDYVRGIATDADGNVLVTGYANGSPINLGGEDLNGTGSYDLLLAKYAPDGTHRWSKRLGGALDDQGYAIAADASGNVLVTGYSTSTAINMGGGQLVGSSPDLVLAKYSPDGVHQWSKRIAGSSSDYGFAVSADPAGNVFVSGASYGAGIDFGGGELPGLGDYDFVLAKYGPDGTYQWSKRLGGNSSDLSYAVVADPSGNVVVGGWVYSTTADFGGGALSGLGSYDFVLAKYASDGTHVWSKRMGGNSFDYLFSLASDRSGNVVFAGMTFSASANVGGGAMPILGGTDVVVAGYAPDGAYLWSKRVGGSGYDYGYGVAVDQAGNVALAGYTNGASADLGGGPLSGAGSYDFIVAKYHVDATAPVSTLTSLPLTTTAPLPAGTVSGSVTDDASGVDITSVTYTPEVGGSPATVPATLTCNESRRSCTFTAPAPESPGVYTATASSRDRANNAEAPGASATLVVV